ncbi:MAG: phage integrase Arm DNA-binding domain-containing protein [Alphaproteobacteria bacterium]|nr:phage integrase Arm DNA-binding domain-containing protein [Alphaproteobacteria bacterium]
MAQQVYPPKSNVTLKVEITVDKRVKFYWIWRHPLRALCFSLGVGTMTAIYRWVRRLIPWLLLGIWSGISRRG